MILDLSNLKKGRIKLSNNQEVELNRPLTTIIWILDNEENNEYVSNLELYDLYMSNSGESIDDGKSWYRKQKSNYLRLENNYKKAGFKRILDFHKNNTKGVRLVRNNITSIILPSDKPRFTSVSKMIKDAEIEFKANRYDKCIEVTNAILTYGKDKWKIHEEELIEVMMLSVLSSYCLREEIMDGINKDGYFRISQKDNSLHFLYL